MRTPAAVVLLTLVTACTPSEGAAPAPGPHDEALSAVPASVVPGGLVTVTSPDDGSVGVAFELQRVLDEQWVTTSVLLADPAGTSPSWQDPQEPLSYPDVGLAQAELVVPPDSEVGAARLCQGPASHRRCVLLEITSG